MLSVYFLVSLVKREWQKFCEIAGLLVIVVKFFS